MISRETERQFLMEHGWTYRLATVLSYGYDPGPDATPEDEDDDDSEELEEFLDPDYEDYFVRVMERD